MKILIVKTLSGKPGKMLELLQDKLQLLYGDMSVEVWDNGKKEITLADVKQSEADLFVNFNLSGFEQDTLTGGIAYNLLNCKQIQILFDAKLPNEKYLSKQLSIAMFFYCVGSDYRRYLLNRYPDIPYLKEIEGWNHGNTDTDIAENADILCGIIQEIVRICHIIS